MNMRYLQFFCDAARTENLAKVAEQYHVPPATVSVAIKHLEEELGVRLFDRRANKIKLNTRGQALAAELRPALETIAKAVCTAEKVETQPPVKVLIRARPRWITELIALFKKQNPEVNFIISNDYTITDIDEFDVIIDEDRPKYRHWARFLLSTEIICIKASAQNPLAHKTLSFSDLKDEVFILPSRGNGMRELYERTCQKHAIRPNVAIECNDRQCLQYYVQADMGLTMGAYRALEDQTQTNMAALKVMDFNETQSVYVFYGKQSSMVAKVFCDFLYEKRYV